MKQKINNGLSSMHGFLNKILKGLFGLTARQRADESTYSAANESTFVKKPVITDGKKIIKNELSDDNSWEINNEDRIINTYPNVRNDKYVLEFFEYDYAPRFQRQNKFAPLYYVNLAKNIYRDTPINIYNNDDYNGGYEHNNKAGRFLGFDILANTQVYLNNKYKLTRPVLVHELTHGFRQGTLGVTGDNRFSSYKTPINLVPNFSIGKVYNGSGYTNAEKDKLNKAYNMDGYKIDYDPLYEKGTTNTEVRFRLWKELYDKLGRRPTLEETDKFIRGYDNNRLGKTIRNANGYGWQMYQNGIDINDAKDALINVAMNDTPESNDYVSYAKKGRKIPKALLGTKILLGNPAPDYNNPYIRGILSWLPFTGTAIDVDNAVKDPSAENLTWSGLSVGLDALSFGVASRGLRAIKNMKKVLSEAIELTAKSKKRYESARKTFNLSHNSNKKYEAMRRAELEYWDNYAKTRHDSEFDAFNGEYWRRLADLEASYNGNKMLFGFGGTEILGVNTLYDKYKKENERTK